ncbi:hypothetical protein D3C86_1396010 [compost metagenome]
MTLQAIVVGTHPTQQRGSLYLVAQSSALEFGKPLADHCGLLLHRLIERSLLFAQASFTGHFVQPGTHVVDTGLHILKI